MRHLEVETEMSSRGRMGQVASAASVDERFDPNLLLSTAVITLGKSPRENLIPQAGVDPPPSTYQLRVGLQLPAAATADCPSHQNSPNLPKI